MNKEDSESVSKGWLYGVIPMPAKPRLFASGLPCPNVGSIEHKCHSWDSPSHTRMSTQDHGNLCNPPKTI